MVPRQKIPAHCFNTQPPEGGCGKKVTFLQSGQSFQHTAARRRLPQTPPRPPPQRRFQHTAARRRLRIHQAHAPARPIVSTHSRPKAAAVVVRVQFTVTVVSTHSRPKAAALVSRRITVASGVSTHSRPKAAAFCDPAAHWCLNGFNTQPPEGGCAMSHLDRPAVVVSTHSRPKAAAEDPRLAGDLHVVVSTHSRPKAAAWCLSPHCFANQMFQHTAARRRLPWPLSVPRKAALFQHTAARRRLPRSRNRSKTWACFNTQPPEGGCAVPPSCP